MTVDVSVLPQDCKFYLDADIMFLNMGSLVEYYSTHVLPSHGSLILRCPYGYSKPRWQGQHNSLTLRKNGFSAVLELNVDFSTVGFPIVCTQNLSLFQPFVLTWTVPPLNELLVKFYNADQWILCLSIRKIWADFSVKAICDTCTFLWSCCYY